MTIDDRLHELGIELPDPYPPAGLYVAAVRAGDLVFLSGAGSVRPDGSLVTELAGSSFSAAQSGTAATSASEELA